MKCGLALEVVVPQGAAVPHRLVSEDPTLLIWRHALLVLDLALDVVDGVGSLDIQRDGLARQRLHEDLHASTL